MRSMVEDKFSRALSLALPGTPVADKDLRAWAGAVLRGGMAMDQADPDDPLSAALDELAETLQRTVPNARDRQAVFDQVTALLDVSTPQRNMAEYGTRSASTSGRQADPSTAGLNENDWPSDVPSPFSSTVRRVPTGPGPTADRRQAADSGSSALDALFAEFPPAARPFG
jgi:hypothetical protein